MERDPAPQSGVLQVCSRMPERPTMPAETTPDRHTEIAADRTAEAAERTRETAVRTTVAAQRTEASADRRTELAANRTVLAAERTYAAWVRTGLVSLAAGVGAKKRWAGYCRTGPWC